MHYRLYCDLPLPPFPRKTVTVFPAAQAKTHAFFPAPQNGWYPSVPQNLLLSAYKNAKEAPILTVQTIDYSRKIPPAILSERQAFALARTHRAAIFHDEIANSAYFCYRDNGADHMVWLEDGFHLHQKLLRMEAEQTEEIALLVTPENAATLIAVLQL